MLLTTVVEGWTGRLGPFTLRVGGAPLPLTGFTVQAIVRRYDGTQAPAGGAVVVDPDQIANTGQVYYDPGPQDFVWSTVRGPVMQPHTLHWKVTDGSGHVVFFPNGEPTEIGVYRQ